MKIADNVVIYFMCVTGSVNNICAKFKVNMLRNMEVNNYFVENMRFDDIGHFVFVINMFQRENLSVIRSKCVSYGPTLLKNMDDIS